MLWTRSWRASDAVLRADATELAVADLAEPHAA